MLERLVAFDTESAKSNLPLIAFVEDYLRGSDVPFLRLPNAGGDKAALFATIGPAIAAASSCRATPTWCRWRGSTGRAIRSRCALPTASAYGRGAVDMKGFCATALALSPGVPGGRAEGADPPLPLL